MAMSEFVTLKTEDGVEMTAYVARPANEPIGALVLVQEIFGINGHIRSVCDGFAADGFLVVAPAIFDRIEKKPAPGVDLNYDAAGKKIAFGEFYPKLNPEKTLLDVRAAYEYAAKAGKKVGIIGYCYGGLMAWLGACRVKSFAAAVGYYAGGIGKFAAEKPLCPVMLHFGANDSHIGADQRDAVKAANPAVEIFVYAGADHAFDRKPDPDAYVAEAAKLARERSVAFLKKNLAN
jgi:carboxymethylenebutenolidase